MKLIDNWRFGVDDMSYWVYQTYTYNFRGKLVNAELITPPLYKRSKNNCGYGFASPSQIEPYGEFPDLTFKVNVNEIHPDNYTNSFGFDLFSERLIKILQQHNVVFEFFPVTMMDRNEQVRTDLKYYVFHSLEGFQPAMDKQKSEWKGDFRIGVPQLILDYDAFNHRPMFLCADIHLKLMRNDLRENIERERVTGFAFLDPGKFHSGRFGLLRSGWEVPVQL